MKEKRVSAKKLKRGFGNLFFLVKPQLKYGWLMHLLELLRTSVLEPIATVAEVTVAQAVITAVQAGKPFRDVLAIALIRLAICFGATLVGWIPVDFYMRWKAHVVNSAIEREIYDHAMKIDIKYMDDPTFFDAYKLATEEFVSRSENTINYIEYLLGSLVTIGAMAKLLAETNPLLILLILTTTLINAATSVYWNRKSAERARRAVKPRRRADYMRRLLFSTATAGDLRSTHVNASLWHSYDKSVQDRVVNAKRYMSREFVVDIFQSMLRWSATFIIVVYVAWGLLNGKIADIGVFATMLAAAQSLSNRLEMFSYYITRFNESAIYAEQVRTFFDLKPILEVATGDELPDGSLSVELCDVCFGYAHSSFRINSICFHAERGEKIAIVGENGAGKSTLTKLLLELYETESGEILYNGLPISNFDVHALRDKIGIAFQSTNIYALSLRENLQVYRKTSDDELRRIIVDVKLTKTFDRAIDDMRREGERLEQETQKRAKMNRYSGTAVSLPTDNPLDVELTREFVENGIVLSGGESQKLGLARLLTGEFGLILLDEPSSALDPLAEYELTKLMFSKANAATTIMIAHRLSTVRDADRIYLMEDGSITETGTHDELMALGGKYREMFTKQGENYISGIDEAE